MDEIILKRINSFTDNIVDQCEVIIPILFTYREYTIIVNIYQTYNMLRLITSEKCKFQMKDYQDYLE